MMREIYIAFSVYFVFHTLSCGHKSVCENCFRQCWYTSDWRLCSAGNKLIVPREILSRSVASNKVLFCSEKKGKNILKCFNRCFSLQFSVNLRMTFYIWCNNFKNNLSQLFNLKSSYLNFTNKRNNYLLNFSFFYC